MFVTRSQEARSSSPVQGKEVEGKPRYSQPFVIFREEVRKQMAGQDIDPIAGISRVASERWKAMIEDQKKPYLNLAAEVRAEKKEAKKSLTNDHNLRSSSPAQGKKVEGKPRYSQPFVIFREEVREQMAGQDVDPIAGISRAASERWKAMTEDQKKPYLNLAAEVRAEKKEAKKAPTHDHNLRSRGPSPV